MLARKVTARFVCRRGFSTFYGMDLPVNASSKIPEERTVDESFAEQILPFSSDKTLRADYLSYTGNIRIGKLLENMDIIAGKVSYLHADPTLQSVIMVTACCDRITLQKKFHSEKDVIVRGFPTHVGKSSMEIRVELLQEGRLMLGGYFLMAARDPNTFKSKQLPKLKLETEEQFELERNALARKKEMIEAKKHAEDLSLPTIEERVIIHDLYLARKHGAQEISLKGTRFDSTLYMHPRDQNIHGHIFGGYLMREAFELAFLTACNFAREETVSFIVMDEIEFIEPVKIGQILNCTAFVTYTDPIHHLIHVSVQAKVVNPKDRSKKVTNTFQFTFRSKSTLDSLNPSSYAESINYLIGRRAVMTILDNIQSKE